LIDFLNKKFNGSRQRRDERRKNNLLPIVAEGQKSSFDIDQVLWEQKSEAKEREEKI